MNPWYIIIVAALVVIALLRDPTPESAFKSYLYADQWRYEMYLCAMLHMEVSQVMHEYNDKGLNLSKDELIASDADMIAKTMRYNAYIRAFEGESALDDADAFFRSKETFYKKQFRKIIRSEDNPLVITHCNNLILSADESIQQGNTLSSN